MTGAGKSSVGHCLCRQTGLTLFDTDEIVKSKFGMSISKIFSTYSEHDFRKAETDVLRKIPSDKCAIIVTGGGIVLRNENLDLLKRLGAVVWLQADEGTLFKRASRTADRPLLQCKNSRDSFSQMLQARLPLYAKAADIRVDTSALTDDEVAVAILSKFKSYCQKSAQRPNRDD